jgi:REP element-mobilizing transposase RayT
MPLTCCLTIFADHHLLCQPNPPLHEYTALAYACKATYELLAKRLQEHKWKTFQPKFLQQLDFVDRFKSAHNLFGNDSDTIVFERRQIPIATAPRPRFLVTSVHRRWNFVKETVTVTVRAMHEKTAWECSYTYDTTRSEQSNLKRIHKHVMQAVRIYLREIDTRHNNKLTKTTPGLAVAGGFTYARIMASSAAAVLAVVCWIVC